MVSRVAGEGWNGSAKDLPARESMFEEPLIRNSDQESSVAVRTGAVMSQSTISC